MKFLKLLLVMCLGFGSTAFAATCFDNASYGSEQCDVLLRGSISATKDLNFRIQKLLNVVKNNSHYHRVAPQVQQLNVRSHAVLRELTSFDSDRDGIERAFQALQRQYRTTSNAVQSVYAIHPALDVNLHTNRVQRSFNRMQSILTSYLDFDDFGDDTQQD